ncbi:sulfotransferase domain-containing protein [Robertkochia aurantiaca]|uniref:sulfotransferase domain-containing protein n=1 Tax=Robertkochia aurantiaca TaxID=2873700 RepID=UPI001CCB52B5|nr:sulfotransferase domain-containing protein [Robertkochia sp. 3YJGBD-33]
MEAESHLVYRLKKGIRQQVFKATMLPRYWSASLRVLPDFMVIGAQKAGTTSLFNYLEQHPDVQEIKRKEIHFFDETYDRGPRYYRSFFPYRDEMNGKISGEATPLYLFDPAVPERVKNLLPDIRFIVLLRNPAKRAISHLHHMKRKGVEQRSLQDLFQKGFDARLQEERDLQDPWKIKTFSYLSRGLYAEQLQRWFRHFDREQFLILKSEDFYSHTREEVFKVMDYLRLEKFTGIDFERAHNQHGYSKPDPALLRDLNQWYKPANEQLEELLERRFHWND